MERMGLVAQVEAELEKMLSLELLPANGILPSEGKLSRCFGVSRGTVREALLRLVAKGLVETHPGRQARAVPLGEAVSLENLGVLLDGDGRLRPDRRRLLEGYLALKRDMTVELLAACCEGASSGDLAELGRACYALGDSAHWDAGDRKWVQHEFALLRLAALAANRPGHVLLIHSLERAFRGMAHWLQPHLHSESVRPWTWCAVKALDEKDAQALRQELPALLQAGDEKLLLSLAPPSQSAGLSESHRVPSAPPPSNPPAPATPQAEGPDEVATNPSNCPTGWCQLPPTGGSEPATVSAESACEPMPAMLGEGRPPGPGGSGDTGMPPSPIQPGGTGPVPRLDAPLTTAPPCTQPCCYSEWACSSPSTVEPAQEPGSAGTGLAQTVV